MKKIRLAGLALLAPLTLLCACSGSTPALTLSANWYKNTAISTGIGNTSERLEYKVELVDVPNQDFTVSYEEGRYVTELKNEIITLADESTEEGYVYTTTFSISGHYTFKGQNSEPFEDSITTRIEFRDVRNQLKPVRSERNTVCTSPTSMSPVSLETAFTKYEFSYTAKYDAALEKAETTYTDLRKENPEPKTSTLHINNGGTYLDNEQVLFALRGLDLTSVASFRSVNPVQNQVQTLTTSSPSAEALIMNIEGATDKEADIDAIKVSLAYKASNPGGSQTLWYAKTTDTGNNTYRNALLLMEVPVTYGLGTLRYTLVKADFTNK